MPYTYLIGWRKLDVWYYGVRTANCSSPEEDLWKKYFTSSKFVKKFRSENGEPDVTLIHKKFYSREDAVAFENRFLNRVNAVSSERWLNRWNGRKNFYVKETQTSEHIQRRKKALKGRKPGFLHRKHTPETKEKIRVSRLERLAQNGKRMGWKHSSETKKKISESRKIYLESLKNA